MYQTTLARREAADKLEKLQNRIGLLKRKEQAMQREVKIRRSLDKKLRQRMLEFAKYKDDLSVKMETSQIQELKKFQTVSVIRSYEIRRKDPLENLKRKKEISAMRQKEEMARLMADREAKKREQLEQVRQRKNQMKEEQETPAQRRFRQSVLNKTNYLKKLGNEREEVKLQQQRIDQLELVEQLLTERLQKKASKCNDLLSRSFIRNRTLREHMISKNSTGLRNFVHVNKSYDPAFNLIKD